jgi:TRAP-type mannitol/chloroaromatic compound transport system substrate-binding protein
MRSGDVLAAECGGAITSYALGLHAVAPYWAGTSINRHGTALSLGIGRALWDRLSAPDQAMFAASASAEFQLSLAEEEAHRNMLYPEPPADRTWSLASELSHAIRRVADAVVAHAAGADAQTRRINDSYTAFRRAAVGADAIA